MKVTIEIPDHQLLEIAKDIMQNYPEASFCLQCQGWQYEKGVYKFYDEDEDKVHMVTVEEIAAKGLPKLIEGVIEGKWHFDGMENGLTNLLDPCCYDAISIDAAVQLTIFGDVIYG